MITYCQSFARNDYQMASEVCQDFIDSVKAIKPNLLYLILHLPQYMLDFGRTSSFNTERYHLKYINFYINYYLLTLSYRCESFNGQRLYNLHTNRHASSLDIATKFARLEHLRCLLQGGVPSVRYMHRSQVVYNSYKVMHT